MKKILTGLCLVSLAVFCVRAADPTESVPQQYTYNESPKHTFGIGAIFGEPTGISAKYWLEGNMAIDGVVGWGFYEDTDFYLHVDWLWHLDLFHVSEGRLPVYVGIGPRLKVRDDKDDVFGVRFPIGISYMFEKVPIETFFEVAPVLDLTPDTKGSFTAGIGIRYWF